MSELSIVRRNLLTVPGYAPYCGADNCRRGMPRTEFRRGQFECSCGWRSVFEPEFIERVRLFREQKSERRTSHNHGNKS